MKSIRSRLTYSYLFIILLTVIILETFMIITIKDYYYENIKQLLKKEATLSSSFYNQYISSGSIENDVEKLLRSFYFNTSAQIQILDTNSRIIGDSMGIPSYKTINLPDIKSSLSGEEGYYIGSIIDSNEPFMSVSMPLRHEGEIVGAIRFISSLESTNTILKRAIYVLLSAGAIIVLLVTGISIFLSYTIINPVKNITHAARQMSSGKFTARASKKYNDEIGELADSLNFMAEEILNHEKLKNEFISSVSHELRTPLTSIKGWAVTLRSGDLKNEGEILEGLDIIEKESDRLTSLVSELLDFSKLESGRISIRLSPLYLSDLSENVYKQMKPRAERLGIDLRIVLEDNLPEIYGDYDRLKQVLINLMDNSLKFTDKGGFIEIRIGYDSKSIILSIEDNGCGIDEVDVPNVMDKFYKGKSSKSGSGIGLSISKEIINLHNGVIDIKSSPGKGTVFTILLPR